MAAQPLFDLSTIDLTQVAVPPDVVGGINPQSGPMRQLDYLVWMNEDSTCGLGVKSVADDEFCIVHSLGERRMPTAEGLVDFADTALAGLVLRLLEAPPLRLEISSGSPRGAGLGASSALAVALLAAVETWLGRDPSSDVRKVAVARDLEAQLMAFPTGIQDHWPAILGGSLCIE